MTASIECEVGDITTFPGDAIVNAANPSLMGGGGVDGAIHRAGGPAILAECRQIREQQGLLPTGQAVATAAGDLPSRYVIHTVGPIWADHAPEAADRLLTDCYTSSLDLGARLGCRTIAFPNISTGLYGFPKPRAAEVAVGAVRAWIAQRPADYEAVTFVCFDRDNADLYGALLF